MMDCNFKQSMKKILLTKKQENELWLIVDTAYDSLLGANDKYDKEKLKIITQIRNKL
tara:strand:- start:109 stop:279 length:171 start_codon:yes stop_codon:yes gene_type:complete